MQERKKLRWGLELYQHLPTANKFIYYTFDSISSAPIHFYTDLVIPAFESAQTVWKWSVATRTHFPYGS